MDGKENHILVDRRTWGYVHEPKVCRSAEGETMNRHWVAKQGWCMQGERDAKRGEERGELQESCRGATCMIDEDETKRGESCCRGKSEGNKGIMKTDNV